jgi:hypothetical protein
MNKILFSLSYARAAVEMEIITTSKESVNIFAALGVALIKFFLSSRVVFTQLDIPFFEV